MDAGRIIAAPQGTSWDYYGSFGIFRMVPDKWQVQPRFPENLNVELLEAMGFHLPTK